MDLNLYRQKLEFAIRNAEGTGCFDKRNIINNVSKICIFGIGKYFEDAYEQYFLNQDIKVDYLCDNNSEKWGKEFKGIKCISPRELKMIDDIVVIPLIGDLESIQKQLENMKINHIGPNELFFDIIANLPINRKWFKENSNKLLEVYDILEDSISKKIYSMIVSARIGEKCLLHDLKKVYSDGEYFDSGVFKLNKNESFIDCGGYDGDSIMKFIKYTENNFDNIYSFEMDKDNFNILKERVSKLDSTLLNKIEYFNFGVWNENMCIKYGKEENGSGESYSFYKADNNLINEKEIKVIEAVKLDEILCDKKVTLIKMDIEGAEQNALKGAEKIIKNQKPKMAICLYHRIDAFWDIPLYLKALVPEYKIDIRHHGPGIGGTVCYAYVD